MQSLQTFTSYTSVIAVAEAEIMLESKKRSQTSRMSQKPHRLKASINVLKKIPSDSVRISITANSKNTIMQPHVHRVGNSLNSSFINLSNFVHGAQTCFVISILLPVAIAQRKFRQKGIIDFSDFGYVALEFVGSKLISNDSNSRKSLGSHRNG